MPIPDDAPVTSTTWPGAGEGRLIARRAYPRRASSTACMPSNSHSRPASKVSGGGVMSPSAAKRLAPVAEQLARDDELGGRRVGHQLEELLLVGDVVIERHGSDAQLGREPAHRDGVDALLVGDPQRRLDDELRAQAAARARP